MGRPSSARSRSSWSSCSRARRHAIRAGRATACSPRIPARAQRTVDQLDLVLVEAIGQHLVGDHDVGRSPGRVLDRGRELHGLRHRHLGRGADQHDRAARRVAEEVADPARLMADRPGPAEPAEGARSLQQAHRVAAGGRVDHDEPALATRAARAREIPRLADADELAGAGRGRHEVAEGVRAPEQRGAGAADGPRHPLLEGRIGIDGDAAQTRRELDLHGGSRIRLPEGSSQLCPRPELAHDGGAPVRDGREGQRRGDGRLADPALARDEGHAPLQDREHGRRGGGPRVGRAEGVRAHAIHGTTGARRGRPCLPARTRRD